LKQIVKSIRTGSKSVFRIRLQQNVFPVGAETMRQTICKVVTVTVAFVISCALPYATRANLDNPHGPKAAAERASIDMPAAAPVQFLAFSRQFGAEGASVDLSAVAPIDILALARGFPTETQWPNFGIPTALPVALPPLPGRGHASAHQTNSNPPSPVPAALFSLPRQLEANVDRVSFGGPVLAPMAFVRFCIRYPQDCKVHRMAFRPVPVTLTKTRKAELVKVNRDVNRAIRPQENLNGVMAEEWLVAPREGDCNDYAVTKRHELLARGWPSRSLLLAEVVVPSGEHHLVLVVRTREDDVVLDSLSWTIRPVSQIHYQWVRAQQAGNPKFWSTINVTRTTRVAMNTR
jgi:predicted transglutaminase-like cysteine proteinase